MTILNKFLLQAKLKASAIHFGVSLIVFALVLAWVGLLAYPSIYFTMAGAIQGLVLVFLVDVVLGPLLSFLVYHPKKPKKEIISDFAIIGMVQLAALSYGLHTLYYERPRAVIIYPNSTATVVTHRELADFAELGDLGQYTKIQSLPVAVLDYQGVQPRYLSLEQSQAIIQATDKQTRQSIALLPDVQNELKSIDVMYDKPYVIAVMAKYNGAYFALNKDLQFVVKFAERPIS